MRALVVYESIFGNTRAVAEAIGAGLRSSCEVEVCEVGEAPNVQGVDLVVVGGPIHAWGMTRPNSRENARKQAREHQHEPESEAGGVREWLDRLPQAAAHAAVAAAFDTSLKSTWFPTGSAARAEARRLTRHGYQLVAAPEHFYVKSLEGPLFDGEAERAQHWGQHLAEDLAELRQGA